MVDRPGIRRVTPSGPGRSARGRAYGGEAPRGSVDRSSDGRRRGSTMLAMVRRLAAAGLLVGALASPARAQANDHGLAIETVSNPRANLVSGGDVLARVEVPWGVDQRRL